MAEIPEITPEIADFIRQLPETAATLSSVADQIKAQIGQVDGRQAQLLETLEKARASHAELQKLLNATAGMVELLGSTTNGLIRDAVAELRDEQIKTRSEIMARIDRLQGTVELVREDGRVNWATADTALNRARNYREEVENLSFTVSSMERRYQTLMALVQELREQNDKKPGT